MYLRTLGCAPHVVVGIICDLEDVWRELGSELCPDSSLQHNFGESSWCLQTSLCGLMTTRVEDPT